VRSIKNMLGAACLAAAFLSAGAHAEDIIVATGSGFVPFHFKEDDKMAGFDIDVWEALAKDAGLTYTLQAMDFNGIIPALQTGQVQAAIAGMTINETRAKVVDFSDGYYESDFLFMVPADSKLTGDADMDGKVIAVKTGTTGQAYAKAHYPNAELRLFPNGENAYLEVMSGRADASLQDKPNALYFIKMNGEGRVKGVGGAMQAEDYGIAFPKGSDLRERVNASLAKIKADGTYATIYRKWFDADPPAN
jgi:glutamine transport system substrate-binding protein